MTNTQPKTKYLSQLLMSYAGWQDQPVSLLALFKRFVTPGLYSLPATKAVSQAPPGGAPADPAKPPAPPPRPPRIGVTKRGTFVGGYNERGVDANFSSGFDVGALIAPGLGQLALSAKASTQATRYTLLSLQHFPKAIYSGRTAQAAQPDARTRPVWQTSHPLGLTTLSGYHFEGSLGVSAHAGVGVSGGMDEFGIGLSLTADVGTELAVLGIFLQGSSLGWYPANLEDSTLQQAFYRLVLAGSKRRIKRAIVAWLAEQSPSDKEFAKKAVLAMAASEAAYQTNQGLGQAVQAINSTTFSKVNVNVGPTIGKFLTNLTTPKSAELKTLLAALPAQIRAGDTSPEANQLRARIREFQKLLDHFSPPPPPATITWTAPADGQPTAQFGPDQSMVLHSGPGDQYPVVGLAAAAPAGAAGSKAKIIGRSNDEQWLVLATTDANKPAWVAKSLVTTSNLNGSNKLPPIDPPKLPSNQLPKAQLTLTAVVGKADAQAGAQAKLTVNLASTKETGLGLSGAVEGNTQLKGNVKGMALSYRLQSVANQSEDPVLLTQDTAVTYRILERSAVTKFAANLIANEVLKKEFEQSQNKSYITLSYRAVTATWRPSRPRAYPNGSGVCLGCSLCFPRLVEWANQAGTTLPAAAAKLPPQLRVKPEQLQEFLKAFQSDYPLTVDDVMADRRAVQPKYPEIVFLEAAFAIKQDLDLNVTAKSDGAASQNAGDPAQGSSAFDRPWLDDKRNSLRHDLFNLKPVNDFLQPTAVGGSPPGGSGSGGPPPPAQPVLESIRLRYHVTHHQDSNENLFNLGFSAAAAINISVSKVRAAGLAGTATLFTKWYDDVSDDELAVPPVILLHL